MKILFCTNKFEEVSNGPAKFANYLLRINEVSSSHSIRILTEDVTEPQDGVYKLNLHYPSFLSLFSQFFRIFAYHREAKRLQQTYDFDVIVYNNAFIGLLSAYRFPYSIGMINDYSNASRTWRDWTFSQLFIKQFLFKQLERWSAKVFSKVIVNSDYLKNYIQREYKLSPNKCYRLYKGVEIIPESREKHIDLNQRIKVLFVKTDYILGGYEDLVEALGQLPYKFLLTIIGPSKFYFERLKQYSSSYDNIELQLSGHQPQEKVRKALDEADIFCVPSRKEALGVANLEALARGVPVVSTNVGGIPEVLDQGRCGWLAPAHNPTELSKAIRNCLEQEELREVKIAYAKQHVKQFDIKHTIQNFIDILR